MKKQKFSDKLKRQVVQEVLSGSMSKEEARRVYGLKGKSGILEWMRKFASINPRDYGVDPIPKLRIMKQETDDTVKLKARIKELEEALKYSQLKGGAYKLMVAIAKKDYGIDLEKKSGAKQFSNSKKKTQK